MKPPRINTFTSGNSPAPSVKEMTVKWDDIYSATRAAGLVKSQRELSRLAGGGPSLMSAGKARGRDPGTAALVSLWAELDRLDRQHQDAILSGLPTPPGQHRTAAAVYQLKECLLAELRRVGRKPRGESQ